MEYQEKGGSYILLDTRTRSELAVPIRVDDRVIGVINVEHPARDAFKREDEIALKGLAAQAAIAIQNARLYEQQRIVTDISRETARQLDLNAFLDTLFTKLVGIFAGRDIPISPSLATYDRASEQLTTYLSESYRNADICVPVRSLHDVGIIPWVAKTKQPYYAEVVSKDSHYLGLSADTRSEFAVPILFGEELLGVLDVESPVAYPFSPEDIQLLQTLADHIATTLNTIRQYIEIERTKDLMAARTAMAWIGMVSSVWRHSIGNQAVTVRDNVPLIRRELEKRTPNQAFVLERLDAITRSAEQILEKPITPPLSSQEGVTSVRTNEFVRKCTERLWYNEPYKLTHLQPLDLRLDESATIRVSEAWLRQAFEIVIDNALEAMLEMPDKQLVIGTREKARHAEIYVTDRGRGIPPDALENLFRKPIDKPQGAKGMGVGLLFVREIMQVYSGEINVGATGPEGTTMLLALPLESSSGIAERSS
jgi:GAF domain-containing protein